MKPQEALACIAEHCEIPYDGMLELMRQIMTGAVSPTLIAAIVSGLRVKKETVGEIAAAAQVMRELSVRVNVADHLHLVDTCGTGGDAAHTFNISTTSAFVAAAAGVKIAKHGGRSVSSKSGSADVLELLGVNLDQTPEQVAHSISEVGLGFMFAPNYHAAMKHAAPVRRELGIRTLFNILGPLTNPAGAKNQVLGVFHPDLVGMLARVLHQLGSYHVLVVHGQDGLDEISLGSETHVGELKDGRISEYIIKPEDFGMQRTDMAAVRVQDAVGSKDMLLSVLDGQPGAAQDIVLLNAGAAIYVGGLAKNLNEGVGKAREVVENGLAKARLQQLIAFSRQHNNLVS